MKYFDAHCHVQFHNYAEDREEVLQRMIDAEVGGLVVGVNEESSREAVALVQGKENLFAAVGLHPNDVQESFDVDAYETMLTDPMVRAVGECGLDYYRPADANDSIKKKQKDIFEQHIELAVKYDKPLMIHSRPSKGTQDAYHDTIDMIRSKKSEYGERLRGDMHFFVGGIDEARTFIELDFSLSYTAVLTFAKEYDDVVRFLPLTHLLTETDAPFIAPASKRGKRNEPTAVIDVVAQIAKIRDEDENTVREAILRNAAQKFSFSLS